MGFRKIIEHILPYMINEAQTHTNELHTDMTEYGKTQCSVTTRSKQCLLFCCYNNMLQAEQASMCLGSEIRLRSLRINTRVILTSAKYCEII